MLPITQDEFNTLVDELICQKPPRYDALCAISEKMLAKKLERKCAVTPALARSCTWEDLLSEVNIRLIKCAIPNFFLRTDELNLDIDGFCRWVYTVAGNVCIDKCRLSASRFTLTTDIDPDSEDGAYLQIADPDAELPFEPSDDTDTLREAFEAVLFMDTKVYKVITWIAQFVIMIRQDVTKIESNDLIIKIFENMTLSEMWDSILRASEKIKWLRVSEEADRHLRKMLSEPFKDGVSYGDTVYSDFYMKKGAKASISDWVNRINSGVRRKQNVTYKY